MLKYLKHLFMLQSSYAFSMCQLKSHISFQETFIQSLHLLNNINSNT